MTLTKLEKNVLLGLSLVLVFGILGIGFRMVAAGNRNNAILSEIKLLRDLTPKLPLEKLEVDSSEDADNYRKLNVHFASVSQLNDIPKIGEVTAKRIVDFVRERKELRSLNELSQIKGISQKTVKHLSQYLTIKGGICDGESGKKTINLNFADVNDVEKLPGIGKKMAKEIIDFRNRNGGIFSLEDLMEIQGMTKDKLKKISSLIVFR